MTDSDEVKLLPCPCSRCLKWPDEIREVVRGKAVHFVGCAECGVSGPRKPTADEAVSAWNEANTRPPVVTDEVVERPPCPTCEGRGVYDSHPIPPDKGPAMEFECYACNGTGLASMPAVVSGGQT